MLIECEKPLGNKSVATLLWQKNCKRGVPCGYGSKPVNTEKAQLFIQEYIDRFEIKSINDAGCGDFSWMKMIDLDGIKYAGFDINSEMLKETRKLHPKIDFFEHDVVNQILPKADLIICRDCLFHLPFESILKALRLFKKSDSKWLIATSHPDKVVNQDLGDMVYSSNDGKYYNENYGFRELNLRLDPINLPKPIDWIDEKPTYNRILAIWNLQEIFNG